MKTNYCAFLGSLSLATCYMMGQAAAQSPIGGTSDWSGPYVGIYGQYSAGHSSQHDSENGPFRGNVGDGSYSISGGLGGGMIGYNYQYQQFVLGIEGDIAGGTISGHSDTCGIFGIAVAHACGTSIDAEGDVLGRLGYAMGSFMPFVTGGFAIQDVHANDTLDGGAGSAWLPGYAAGAGIEYKVTPNISLRVEYLHTEVKTGTLFDIIPNVPERISTREDSVRAGVSFSFGTPVVPVVAKY